MFGKEISGINRFHDYISVSFTHLLIFKLRVSFHVKTLFIMLFVETKTIWFAVLQSPYVFPPTRFNNIVLLMLLLIHKNKNMCKLCATALGNSYSEAIKTLKHPPSPSIPPANRGFLLFTVGTEANRCYYSVFIVDFAQLFAQRVGVFQKKLWKSSPSFSNSHKLS